MRRGAAERGFTLIELLVSMGIMLAVLASIFSILNPAQGTYQAQPEVSDMQQRLRVGVDSLNRDLLMAGAGTYSGSAVGALLNYFAPIMPYRMGAVDPDPPGTFKSDTITFLYVPETTAQTTISQSMPHTSNEIKVNEEPGCPEGDSLCGFEIGMQVLIFDGTGAWNTFVITNVQEPALHIQRHGPDFNKDYDTGAYIAQVSTHTYYLKSDDQTETYQLMHYDGDQTDAPVVDNVVGLEFEYYGDPQPPRLRKPVTDPVGPWTTYGPKPPPLGVSAGLGWADGENCVFTVSAGQQEPRLADLAPGSTGLVKLTPDMLTDGPWCPGPAVDGRFDADLLRIRQVRVTLRVQAGLKTLRGAQGPLFARGGSSRSGLLFVPDQEVRFDVAPRNLNLGR
jgi:prepilin-type N-terminal cleavage/methylation domain-containing protein